MQPALVIPKVPERTGYALFALLGSLSLACALFVAYMEQPRATVLLFIGFFGITTLSLYYSLSAQSRIVAYDKERKVVLVKSRPMLLRTISREYDASNFHSIVSYYTPYPIFNNSLELLASNGRDGLTIMTCRPVSLDRGALKLPTMQEHPLLVAAREEWAAALNVENGGFVGVREAGPRVRANAA